MTYAIIRGKNGRRHEVDFEDSPVRVEVYASDETIEILVEADTETQPEERRRFALLNIPRQQFSQGERRGGAACDGQEPLRRIARPRPWRTTRVADCQLIAPFNARITTP